MCTFIQDTHIMPGSICCQCRAYNGLQREFCKFCRHKQCKLEIPDSVKQCPTCQAGYPDELPPRCLVCGTFLGGKAQIEQLGGSGPLNASLRPDQS